MACANGTFWYWASVLLLLVVAPTTAIGQELKDPYQRDEDISQTNVEVEYRQEGSGLWVYDYTIKASEPNKGTINGFSVDLACSVKFEASEIVPEPVSDSEIKAGGPANVDPVTPVAIRADSGAAADFNISRFNSAYWILNVPPGSSAGKLRLISIASPGLREYELEPRVSTEGYDYSEPVISDAPSDDDFRVTGVIAGPGCPGEVPPVEEPTFPGNEPANETEEMNQLLIYKEPLQNRLHLEEGERHARLTILYGDDLDPETFHVQPGWAKRFFLPRPGTEQTVDIPMRRDRLRLVLEGHRKKSEEAPEGKKDAPPEPARKDRDEFEFRLPESKSGERKGQGNGD